MYIPSEGKKWAKSNKQVVTFGHSYLKMKHARTKSKSFLL